MAANETILHGAWIDYSQGANQFDGPSYGGGGTIAGSALALLEGNLAKQFSFVNFNSGNWMSNGVFQPFNPRITNLDIQINAGRLPMSPFSNWDQQAASNNYSIRLAAIAAGTPAIDNYLTTFANDAKAWGKPLLLRFGWEQNLQGQFPWQHGKTGGGVNQQWGPVPVSPNPPNNWTNTTQDYIDAWRHMVDIFHNAGCFNVKWVWCPNVMGTGDTVTMAQMFPGSAYVDWLGLDGYPYSPTMTLGQEFRGTPGFSAGNADFPNGGGTGLQDSYAAITALDPVLPLMIGETGINGIGGTTGITITSLVPNGTNWTITTAAPPNTRYPWAQNEGVWIQGVVPTGYNGQFVIASSADTTHFVVTNSLNTAVTSLSGATVQMMQRNARALSYKTSLETDIPNMPRIKALCWFWTLYGPNQWTPDFNGSLPNTVDMQALKAAVGNAHYLAGNQMGTNLATRSWDPFQDQPMIAGSPAGTVERYRAVSRSVTGLVGAWNMNDVAGPIADDSGNGRTIALVGTAAVGGANVIPAEPSWTSLIVPGTIGNYGSLASNAAFSPATTGKFSIEFSFIVPTTPTVRGVLIGKYATGQFEYDIFVTATNFGMILHPLTGGTFAGYDRAQPGGFINTVHHVVFTVDLSNLAAPITGYVDGAGSPLLSGVGSGSVPTAGTSIVTFGQTADATQPVPANTRYGPCRFYNYVLTVESVADLHAAWIAAPAITLGPSVS